MKMIYCKDCKKFAKITHVWMNGADEVKLAGSCKHCGYDENPNLLNENGEKIPFQLIPESRVDFTGFEELGINR